VLRALISTQPKEAGRDQDGGVGSLLDGKGRSLSSEVRATRFFGDEPKTRNAGNDNALEKSTSLMTIVGKKKNV